MITASNENVDSRRTAGRSSSVVLVLVAYLNNLG